MNGSRRHSWYSRGIGVLTRTAALVLVLAWSFDHVADADPQSPAPVSFSPDSLYPAVERIVHAATNSTVGYKRLVQLCDTFGPRFSGTTNLEAALDWMANELGRDGFENVRSEPVLVPRWVRGEESLDLIEPRPQKLRVLALGGSVGTPAEGIVAEVLVVRDFDDLRTRAGEARGKIVLYNFPFVAYGAGLSYRSRGAIEAAKAGAVASLVRSLTPFSMQTPHTGTMRYDERVPRIPHAAITVEDAAYIARCSERGQRLVAKLALGAQTLPDATSRNIIAEFEGREKPEEIVVIGGHTDSWDVSPGAIDDAGGCVATWEALRLLRELGLRPRRTIRLVLWVNEENGLRGARTYATNHVNQLPMHVLAIESDLGVFRPVGFAFEGSGAALDALQRVAGLLNSLGAGRIEKGEPSADTWPLAQSGVPVMELLTEREKYFWFHHTQADTVDKVNPDEFNQCVAALAVMVYAVGEMPDKLPR